jgi:hypothetical protein
VVLRQRPSATPFATDADADVDWLALMSFRLMSRNFNGVSVDRYVPTALPPLAPIPLRRRFSHFKFDSAGEEGEEREESSNDVLAGPIPHPDRERASMPSMIALLVEISPVPVGGPWPPGKDCSPSCPC